jgi:hypothetical protein
MRKNIIFPLLLFICSYVFADSFSDSLRTYYSTVALAEEQTCENNFSQAALLYQKAFTYKSNPFFEDVSNALECELRTNAPNKDNCYNYYKILLQKGLHRGENASDIKKYIVAKFPLKFKKRIQHLTNKYITEYNEITQIIDSILYDDQTVRLNDDRTTKLYFSEEDYKKMEEMDSINTLKLSKLFQDSKYLDENSVGYEHIYSKLWVIMHHNSRYVTGGTEPFLNILKNNVLNGIFDARKYIDFYDKYYSATTVSKVFEEKFGLPQNIRQPIPMSEILPVSTVGYYGTKLLYVFADSLSGYGETRRYERVSALINLNRNDTVAMQQLDSINKHRSEVFLGDVIKECYREFCFGQRQRSKDYGFHNTAGASIYAGLPNWGKNTIKELLDKGWNIDYYIQDEHDFDFNFK